MGKSSRRALTILVAIALAGLAVIPAQAEHVDPTMVPGGSTCTTVGSAGLLSLRINEPTGVVTRTVGTATFTLTVHDRKTFSFESTNATVYDVIVKGAAANHYDFDGDGGGPVTSHANLVIPNGNKLNHVEFCYDAAPAEPEGTPVVCGVPVVVTDDDGTTGTFTRQSDEDCDEPKFAFTDVVDETIIFIPSGGDGDTIYLGELIFTKDSSDPTALVLQYDPDDDGVFKEMPDCADGPALPNETDTWCVISASADYQLQRDDVGNWIWVITWDVYGEGDPKFR